VKETTFEHIPEVPASGDRYAAFGSRNARDDRAIRVVSSLLIGGVALERQVMALVRVRSRS
jgi:hypothetical protein